VTRGFLLRRRTLVVAFAVVLFLWSIAANAQFKSTIYTLTDAEQRELTSGRDELGRSIDALKERLSKQPALAARIPDAEIYFEAVDRNLRQKLFFGAGQVKQARACLAEGRRRVEALSRRETPWLRKPGIILLGHRSEVDGSVQPFSIYVPEGRNLDEATPAPLDIFLHGRGGNLNELTFISSTGWLDSTFGKGIKPKNLVLYPYGRGNNGWRFAGERDLFESLATVKKLFKVDDDRISLRGFSMGGHGAWQIGLHYPGLWSVVSPGAGFVDTKRYQNITTPMPAWQESLLHLYDPIDYVANAANVPVLAYMGDKDPKFDQHKLIMSYFAKEHVPVREFVGKDTEHKYEPSQLAEIVREMSAMKRDPAATSVDFVTYTTRFGECKWVRIDAVEHHWERAEIHAAVNDSGQVEIRTNNVSALTLTPPDNLFKNGSAPFSIDSDNFAGVVLKPGEPRSLAKENGHWAGTLRGLRKRFGISGPIDDALFGPVLAVRGTETPWSAPLAKWLDEELRRTRDGWDVFFRGRLPECTDQTITPDDVRTKNLYLFGDPGSNLYLRKILPRLPITWTKDAITVAGKSYPTSSHVPMLVFPNPDNPPRYVVINCGFSFSRADWEGSNARQYPHLPDWAVVRFDPDHFTDDRTKDTVAAGFFDEQWKMATSAH
jgi:poly(3-hydroxybutyrate) depolymerase